MLPKILNILIDENYEMKKQSKLGTFKGVDNYVCIHDLVFLVTLNEKKNLRT